MGSPVSKLVKSEPREIWANEATEFTPWLEENIGLLDEALDLSLEVVRREQSTGSFKSDLLAMGGSGQKVVIECQLDEIDHAHIGKALTYLANLDAATVVWICGEARTEHVNTIQWLNSAMSGKFSFYLVTLKIVRIDDSKPAPLFTVEVAPHEEPLGIDEPKEELAETEQKRRRFWDGLLQKSNLKTNLFSAVSPSTNQWVFAGAGRTGLAYMYSVMKKRADVLLRIYTGSKEENDRVFSHLESNKDAVEKEFGRNLTWERDETKAIYYVGIRQETVAFQDEDQWPALQDSMVEMMTKLESCVKKLIDTL